MPVCCAFLTCCCTAYSAFVQAHVPGHRLLYMRPRLFDVYCAGARLFTSCKQNDTCLPLNTACLLVPQMHASPWLRPVQEFISPSPTPAGSPGGQGISLAFSPASTSAAGPAGFAADCGMWAPASAPASAPPINFTVPAGWNLAVSLNSAGPPLPPASVPAKLRHGPGFGSGGREGNPAGGAAGPAERGFDFGGENMRAGPAAVRAEGRQLFAQSPEALRAPGGAPPLGSAGKLRAMCNEGTPEVFQGPRRPFGPANLNLAHAAPAPAPGLAGDSQPATPTLFAAHEGFEASRGPSQAPGSGPRVSPAKVSAAAPAAEHGAAVVGRGADGATLQGAPGDATAGRGPSSSPASAHARNPAGSGALAVAEEGTWRIAAVGARSRSGSDSSGARRCQGTWAVGSPAGTLQEHSCCNA